MKKTFLLFLIVALFSSCKTVPEIIPDSSGAITDTQADIAAGAATITAGADTIADQADDLAGAVATLGNETLTAQAEKHAADAKKHAQATLDLQKSIEAARVEVVSTLKRSAQLDGLYNDTLIKYEKAKWQRNTIAAILCGIALITAIFLFFKIKKFFRV